MKNKFRTVFIFLVSICSFVLLGCGSRVSTDNLKLSFVVDDQIIYTLETSGNEEIAIPDDPVKYGYTFEGWYWDNGTWKMPFTANSLLDTPIKSNMNVYAHFVQCHVHVLSHVEAEEPTCTTDGNSEYWVCSCNKMFADAEGRNELDAVPVIAAKGHSHESDWTKDATHHWHKTTCEHQNEIVGYGEHTYDSNNVCSVCGYKTKKNYDMSGVKFSDKTVIYNGNAQSIEIGGSLPSGVTVVYEGNGQTDVGEYVVTAKFFGDAENYELIDDKRAVLKIEKADYDMSGVVFDDDVLTYDGEPHSLRATNLPVGVTVTYSGNGYTDAGEYNITANFASENKNYNKIPSKTACLTIEKADYDMSGVVFADDVLTYDGEPHSLRATNLPAGVTVSYSGNGYTDAGEYNITANFASKNKNYNKIPSKTACLTIEKADYDMSGVVFADDVLTYDGEPHSLRATNLPVGVTVTYSGNGYTDAGEYNVTANFVSENKNYNKIPSKTACLTIEKADYDMSGVVFADDALTYDGEPHSLRATNLPAGVTVSYSGNGYTDAGEYNITANFASKNKNYNKIPSKTACLTIEKADYDMSGVVFDDSILTYDGEPHSLRATNLPVGVTVTYSGNGYTDAGEYNITANFASENKNYNKIPSKTACLTIEKAEIHTTNLSLTLLGSYESRNGNAYTVEYDGQTHRFTINNLPNSLSVVYYYGGQQVDGISARGTWDVTARLSINNRNYKFAAGEIDALEATLTIKSEIYTNYYELYSALGKAINLITASDIEANFVKNKSIFKDELYYYKVSAIPLGKQKAYSESTTSYSKSIDKINTAAELKVNIGSKKNKNGGFLTNKIPTVDVGLDVTYEANKREETNSYFFNYSWVKSGQKVAIDGFSPYIFGEFLSDALLADAKKVTDSQSAKRFIETWGTHIITEAYYGEKINASYSCVQKRTEDQSSFQAKLDAEIDKRFTQNGVNMNADIAIGIISGNTTKDSYKKLDIDALSVLPFGATNFDNFAENYNTWISNHVGNENSYNIFCDVPDNSLYCIWDLLDPEEYGTAIKYLNEEVSAQCGELYTQKMKAVNSLYRDDIKFDKGTQTLTIDLKNFQRGIYNISDLSGISNGVLELTPQREGVAVKKVVVEGMYKLKDDQGIIVENIIKGFSLKFHKNWDTDLTIELNNIAFNAPDNTPALDFSGVTKSINVAITFDGVNVIRGGNGTVAKNAIAGNSYTSFSLKEKDTADSFTLYGGNGVDGLSSGANGSNGAVGIYAFDLTVKGTINVYGGSGGNGKPGSNGTPNLQFGGGKHGQNGGSGGYGAVSINVFHLLVLSGSKLTAFGGSGGNGANGGNGAMSSSGKDATFENDDLDIKGGGHGGHGGAGGNGGDGVIVKDQIVCYSDSVLTLKGGNSGFGGNGGNGAQGCKGFSCDCGEVNHRRGGLGGYGGNGGNSGYAGYGLNMIGKYKTLSGEIKVTAGNNNIGGNGGNGGNGGDGNGTWFNSGRAGNGGNAGSGGNAYRAVAGANISIAGSVSGTSGTVGTAGNKGYGGAPYGSGDGSVPAENGGDGTQGQLLYR